MPSLHKCLNECPTLDVLRAYYGGAAPLQVVGQALHVLRECNGGAAPLRGVGQAPDVPRECFGGAAPLLLLGTACLMPLGQREAPELDRARLLSRATFWWVTPTLDAAGRKGRLELDDMPRISAADEPHHLARRLEGLVKRRRAQEPPRDETQRLVDGGSVCNVDALQLALRHRRRVRHVF